MGIVIMYICVCQIYILSHSSECEGGLRLLLYIVCGIKQLAGVGV